MILRYIWNFDYSTYISFNMILIRKFDYMIYNPILFYFYILQYLNWGDIKQLFMLDKLCLLYSKSHFQGIKNAQTFGWRKVPINFQRIKILLFFYEYEMRSKQCQVHLRSC